MDQDAKLSHVYGEVDEDLTISIPTPVLRTRIESSMRLRTKVASTASPEHLI